VVLAIKYSAWGRTLSESEIYLDEGKALKSALLKHNLPFTTNGHSSRITFSIFFWLPTWRGHRAGHIGLGNFVKRPAPET
jgi:hypothetical protein